MSLSANACRAVLSFWLSDSPQGSALGVVDNPVQLFHIHVDMAARDLFHNRLSKSRKFEFSG